MNYKKALGLLTISTIFWGLNGVFVKNITSFTSHGITIGRLAIALTPFIFWVLFHKKSRNTLSKGIAEWKKIAILGAIMGSWMMFSILAYSLTRVAVAQTLTSISMFFTIILAPLFIKEKVSGRDILFMIIASIGISIVFGIDSQALNPAFLQGDSAGLLASAFVSLYGILVFKFKLDIPFPVLMTGIFSSALLTVIAICLLLQFPIIAGPITLTSVLNLIGIGLLGTFVGQTIFTEVIKHTKPEKVNTYCLTSTIWAYLFGLIFLSETLSLSTISGIAITLIGVYGVIKSHRPAD